MLHFAAPKLRNRNLDLFSGAFLHSIGAVASVFSKPYKFFPILCIPSPQIRGDRFEEVNWSIISYYYTVESPYPSMKFLIFWKISKSLSKPYIYGLRTRIECEPGGEHSTRSDRVTNIGCLLSWGASTLPAANQNSLLSYCS